MDSNAEGFGPGGNQEFHIFLSYSKGCCNELKSQLYSCFDKELITKNEFDTIIPSVALKINKLGAFIHYLRNFKKDLFLPQITNHKL